MDVTQEQKQQIADANRANPYVDVTPWILGVSYPIVMYSGFHPDFDEILLYAASASTYKDKRETVGYAGRSAGYSVRVTKHVSVRSGASGGRVIKETVRHTNSGDLIITSKRVLFIGADDAFDFPVSKISAIQMIDAGSFVIVSGRSSKNVQLNSTTLRYAYRLIDTLLSLKSQGQDIYSHIRAVQSGVTPDQLLLCSQIRQECQEIQPTKAPKKQGCLTGCAKFLFVLVALIFIINMVYSCSSSGESADLEDTTVSTVKYSQSDLLNIANHPKVQDSYEDTLRFYENIDDVKVMTRYEYSQYSGRNDPEDPAVLLFIRNSTYEEYVGSVLIHLYDESLTKDMTTDKAVKLLFSYLPDDIAEYYSKDRAFQYSTDKSEIYTYSGRLNDAGIEYRNNGHELYSYYFAFEVTRYTDGSNQWVVTNDVDSYGGHDIGWIDTHTNVWDVDLNDFT